MQYNCGKKATIKGHPSNTLIKRTGCCLKVTGVAGKAVAAVGM